MDEEKKKKMIEDRKLLEEKIKKVNQLIKPILDEEGLYIDSELQGLPNGMMCKPVFRLIPPKKEEVKDENKVNPEQTN